MDILDIPFNRFIGLKRAEEGSPYILRLDDQPEYRNHLGTVHASVQLALAEATSGEYLQSRLSEVAGEAFAVVRRAEAKFRNPITAPAYSAATIQESALDVFLYTYQARGRGLLSVEVEVVDGSGAVGLAVSFEWFLRKTKPAAGKANG